MMICIMSACNFGASYNAMIWSLFPSRMFCYFQTDNVWRQSVNFWYDHFPAVPGALGFGKDAFSSQDALKFLVE